MKTTYSPKASWVRQNYTCEDCINWTGSPLHCKKGIILVSGELCLVRSRRFTRRDQNAGLNIGGSNDVKT